MYNGKTRLHLNPEKVNLSILVLLFIPVWLLNFVGIYETGYSLISYFAMFLIGYYLFAMDPVQAMVEKYWVVLLAVMDSPDNRRDAGFTE